ncbi:MAG TPA: hypothetical protein VM328_10400, partial [Fimbriimonadaceae bacterium]|nr:hypothetical protein [Fimbriimonadaceae bacterium]
PLDVQVFIVSVKAPDLVGNLCVRQVRTCRFCGCTTNVRVPGPDERDVVCKVAAIPMGGPIRPQRRNPRGQSPQVVIWIRADHQSAGSVFQMCECHRNRKMRLGYRRNHVG